MTHLPRYAKLLPIVCREHWRATWYQMATIFNYFASLRMKTFASDNPSLPNFVLLFKQPMRQLVGASSMPTYFRQSCTQIHMTRMMSFYLLPLVFSQFWVLPSAKTMADHL